jgi:hypothetical protein
VDGDATTTLPIGRSGRLEAVPLTNGAGVHALLVRESAESRALVTGEVGDGARERVVVVPLDDDVELRVDGDALAIWLAEGSIRPEPASPAWASAIGFGILLLLVVLLLIGSATVLGWLLGTTGIAR